MKLIKVVLSKFIIIEQKSVVILHYCLIHLCEHLSHLGRNSVETPVLNLQRTLYSCVSKKSSFIYTIQYLFYRYLGCLPTSQASCVRTRFSSDPMMASCVHFPITISVVFTPQYNQVPKLLILLSFLLQIDVILILLFCILNLLFCILKRLPQQ